METTATDISTAQRASWNKFSTGWRKWDGIVMEMLRPHGEAIMDHLGATGTSVVLDVAKEKAVAAGITNVEFLEADANALPFADNTFDEISCRHGFMFFPDMQQAANEMARVLKPGGRIAVAVWAGPEQNFWVSCMQRNISKHIAVPPPEPGAPGMFRCAQPGLLAGIFRKAGLREVQESEVPNVVPVSGPQQYWHMMTEVAAPFVAALSNADAGTVEKVKADVLADMAANHPHGNIPARGLLIAAVK